MDTVLNESNRQGHDGSRTTVGARVMAWSATVHRGVFWLLYVPRTLNEVGDGGVETLVSQEDDDSSFHESTPIYGRVVPTTAGEQHA